jgi:precorrin-8X/cobalt-precorrin-8 methylmutase
MNSQVTEQLTAAGAAIEHDSFAIIDREVAQHDYTAEQWPLVRRMIHATADFEFNGLARFHPDAMRAGLNAVLRRGTTIVADGEMICAGLRCASSISAWRRDNSSPTPT